MGLLFNGRTLLLAGACGGVLVAGSALTGLPVSDLLHAGFGWARGATVGYDADGCKKDPVGCLTSEGSRLETTRQRIEGALAQLRPATASVREIIHGQEVKAAQADLFLQDGRRLLKAATSPDAPISFIGASYPNSEALKRQLSLIWAERTHLETFLGVARTQVQALQSREQDLLVARGAVAAQLAMLPAQIELARAAGVLASFDSTLRGIDAAVAGGEAPVGGLDTLMRDTSQLMQDQSSPAAVHGGPAGADSGFETFLNGNP